MIAEANSSIASADDTETAKISDVKVDLKVRGLGSYDVMSNALGPLIDGLPASLSVYTKYAIGWMTPIQITSDGIYTLEPSSKNPNNAFVIRHPIFAENEYILIEYRSATEYDANLFGGGLLIYHVDDNKRVQGGSTLPYGSTKSHLKVAVIQSDGKYDIELGINNGDDGDFWKTGMIFEPSGVNNTKDEQFYPNTDSYHNGYTGLSVYVVKITNSGNDTHNNNTYATIEVKGMGDGSNDNNSSMPPISTFSPTSNKSIPTASPSILPFNIASTMPSVLISNVPSDVPSTTTAPVVPSGNTPTTSTVSPFTISPTLQSPGASDNTGDSNGDSITSKSYINSSYCVTSFLMLWYLLFQY